MSVRNDIPGTDDRLFEGDTKQLLFIVEDMVDLTGYTVEFGAFRGEDQVIDINSATTPTQIAIDGNQIQITLLPSDTRNNSGKMSYELEIRSPDSKVYTVSHGFLVVTGDRVNAV